MTYLKEIIELSKEITTSKNLVNSHIAVVGWVSSTFSSLSKNTKINLNFELKMQNDPNEINIINIPIENNNPLKTEKLDINLFNWVNNTNNLEWVQTPLGKPFNKIKLISTDNTNITDMAVAIYILHEDPINKKPPISWDKVLNGKIKNTCKSNYRPNQLKIRNNTEHLGTFFESCYLLENSTSYLIDNKNNNQLEEFVFAQNSESYTPITTTTTYTPITTTANSTPITTTANSTPITTTANSTPITTTANSTPITTTANSTPITTTANSTPITTFKQYEKKKKSKPTNTKFTEMLKYVLLIFLSLILIKLMKT